MALLRTSGREMLRCRTCGAIFPEARATEDGWRYRCPEADCDGAGLNEGLVPLEPETPAP